MHFTYVNGKNGRGKPQQAVYTCLKEGDQQLFSAYRPFKKERQAAIIRIRKRLYIDPQIQLL